MSTQSETSPCSSDPGRTAVILLNFGGPRSLDEVRPFLKRIFSDRCILRLWPRFVRLIGASFISAKAAPFSMRKYELIGGSSPVVEISLKQAAALEKELERRGKPMKVYTGMRYSSPSIQEALLQAIADGTRQVRLLPLYPHNSITTTGSAFVEYGEAVRRIGNDEKMPDGLLHDSYAKHPSYISSVAEKVRGALSAAQAQGEEPEVLFSAHSIPKKLVKRDSTYREEIRSTAQLVAEVLELDKYEFAYQSGGKRWLGPSVEEALAQMASRGCKSVVVVPLSFTCDNIETLYDIDIKLKAEADRLGVKMRRSESLNDSPAFIGALADIVLGIRSE